MPNSLFQPSFFEDENPLTRAGSPCRVAVVQTHDSPQGVPADLQLGLAVTSGGAFLLVVSSVVTRYSPIAGMPAADDQRTLVQGTSLNSVNVEKCLAHVLCADLPSP